MNDREAIAQTAAMLERRVCEHAVPATRGSHVSARDAIELHRLATRLHRFAERLCNENLACPTCQGDGTLPRGNGIKPAPGTIERRVCHVCAGAGNTLGRRQAKIEARVREIATDYSMRVYFQGDCRGCPVYLIPNETASGQDDSSYNSIGTAICHVGR